MSLMTKKKKKKIKAKKKVKQFFVFSMFVLCFLYVFSILKISAVFAHPMCHGYAS